MKRKNLLLIFLGFFALTSAYAQNYVSLYTDCNYGGSEQKFKPGSYSLSNSRIGRNNLSSIRVPSGMKVIIYTSDQSGNGQKTSFTSDASCLVNQGWNDRANSIVVSSQYEDNNNVPPPPNNNTGVTIFEDCNYRGYSSTLGLGYHDVNNLGIRNDQLSSMRVPYGYTVTLYTDGGFRGRSVSYSSDVSCLARDWNDQVSSIYITRSDNNNNNNNNNQSGQVTLFEDCSYMGYSVNLGLGYHDVNNLGIRNDQLSSMRVPYGYTVTLYTDGGFRGRSVSYSSDVSCLTRDWNDQVSSIYIARSGNNNNNNNNNNYNGQVTLFEDCNYRGYSVNLGLGYHDVNNLGIRNDQLSSLRIPGGYQVTLYADAAFRGRSIVYSNDINCLPSGWNDMVSSVYIARSGNNNNNNNPGGGWDDNNPTDQVIIYENEGYSGRSASLRPGSYANMWSIGFPDNALSSLQLPRGWRVVLFDQPNFKGNSYSVMRSKDRFMLSGWGDRTSSLIIYTSGGNY